MAEFSDLIAALQSDSPPESIYDDLTAAYGERAQLAESAGARVAELEAANAALLAEIGDLKARNYDLLVRVGMIPRPIREIPGLARMNGRRPLLWMIFSRRMSDRGTQSRRYH